MAMDNLRSAFELQDKNNRFHPNPEMMEIRWENKQKQSLRVDVETIVYVAVRKTDEGNWHLQLKTIDGLWCSVQVEGGSLNCVHPVGNVSIFDPGTSEKVY